MKEYSNSKVVQKMIEQVMNTFPITEDSLERMSTLLKYLDSLTNGDDIEQYVTGTYLSKYAKEALEGLISEKYKHKVNLLREQSAKLQEETNSLNRKKDSLTTDVSFLSQQKVSLLEQVANLQSELFKISNELLETKQEKSQLSNEITILRQEKMDLELQVKKLQGMLEERKKELDSTSFQVQWVPIDETHPLYNINSIIIDAYIASLQSEYEQKMKVSKEQTSDIFGANCPGIYSIASILNDMAFNYFFKTDTLGYLIKSADTAPKEYYDTRRIQQLKPILQTIKLPKYERIHNKITSTSTIEENKSIELAYKTIAHEETIKRKTLEEQYTILLQTLMKAVPYDYDWNLVLQSCKLELDVKPKGGLK